MSSTTSVEAAGARSRRAPVPTSPAFEEVANGAQFRDLIAVRVKASPEVIFRAVRAVTLSEMKLAHVAGDLRYLPARLAGHMPPVDRRKPFFSILVGRGTLVLRDDTPREIITGSAGQLHRILDQVPVRFQSERAFRNFDNPDYEKLFMSLRVSPARKPGEYWLVLEHATKALSPEAERSFARYWRVIKPGGAFVSRQLLQAIRDRAERGSRRLTTSTLRWSAAGAALTATAYAAYAGVTWCRYGHPSRPKPEERDSLLDRFMPVYDVVERHHIRVDAPADVTLDAARRINIFDSPAAKAMFRGRELLLGSSPAALPLRRGLLAEVESLGWVVLAESAGEEIVIGAVTRPWEANVTFRSVPPERFWAFNEPDYVKIAWTLRADSTGPASSIFRTETRAVATDPAARAKFRRYWSFLSPGIFLIRQAMLGPAKAAAEARAHESVQSAPDPPPPRPLETLPS